MVGERWKIGHIWKKDKENIQKTGYPKNKGNVQKTGYPEKEDMKWNGKLDIK